MFGGLENLQFCVTSDDDSNLNSKRSKRNDTEVAATSNTMTRCSIDVMKQWTTAYPPNVRPMCLHAAYLKVRHPVTGEICEWNIPSVFFNIH
jgi:hypothetical protein